MQISNNVSLNTSPIYLELGQKQETSFEREIKERFDSILFSFKALNPNNNFLKLRAIHTGAILESLKEELEYFTTLIEREDLNDIIEGDLVQIIFETASILDDFVSSFENYILISGIYFNSPPEVEDFNEIEQNYNTSRSNYENSLTESSSIIEELKSKLSR